MSDSLWRTTQQASEPLFQTHCWHSLVLPHLILPQTKHCATTGFSSCHPSEVLDVSVTITSHCWLQGMAGGDTCRLPDFFCHPLELRHHRRSQLCIRSPEPDLHVSPYLLIPAVCCSPSPSLLHGPLFSAVLSSERLFLPPVCHLCWQSVLWFLLQVKLFFNLWCSPPQTKH